MVLDSIKAEKQYRGQIVGVLELPGELAQASQSGEKPFSGSSAAALRVLANLGIAKLSETQASFLVRFRECVAPESSKEGATIILVGAPGSGKTTAQLMAAIETVYLYGLTVLWICRKESLDNLRARLDRAWVPGTSGAVRCISLGNDTAGVGADAKAVPSLVLATPEAVRAEILKNPKNWRNYLSLLGSVVVDDIDLYSGLSGAEAATVVRRFTRLAQQHGADPVVIAGMGPCSNVASYLELMIGRKVEEADKDIFRFGLPPLQKRLVFWSSPLDFAAGGAVAGLSVVNVLEDVESLLEMLVAGGVRVYVAGEFIKLTGKEFENLRAGIRVKADMIQRVTSLEDLSENDTRASAIVILGLPENLDVLCNRLAAVGGAETTIFIVSARQPLFNLASYLARCQRAKLSASGTSRDRVSGGIEIPGSPDAIFKACSYPNPFVIVGHILEQIQLLQSRDKGIGLQELEAIYGSVVNSETVKSVLGSHPNVVSEECPRYTKSGAIVDEQVYRFQQGAGGAESVVQRVPEAFASDYYPQSIIIERGERYKIVAVGSPVKWGTGLHLDPLSGADLGKRTQRSFSVFFCHVSEGKMASLACGLPWRVNVSRVTESITGFRLMDRVSGDVEETDGRLSEPLQETWTSPVLELDFSNAIAKENLASPDGKIVNTIRHLIYHAMGEVVIGVADSFECIPLAKDGGLPASPENVARLAIYSRYPGSGVMAEAFATDQRVLALLHRCLDLLVACPCSEGCRNCVAPMYHVWGQWANVKTESDSIDKTGTMEYLAALLKRKSATAIASDRESMDSLVRIQSRIRDVLVPWLFGDQMGLKFNRPPVPLEALAAQCDVQTDGVYTGHAVQLRLKLSEQRYLGLIAHEYAHQWQDAMSPLLKMASADNIEDKGNILFPAFDLGSWQCGSKLYSEGSAQWIAFRVLSVFNDRDGMDVIRTHNVDEYGEGFQYLMSLEKLSDENSGGLNPVVQHLLGNVPLYKTFDAKNEMYTRTSLYSALEDACISIIQHGGLCCANGMTGWPKYMRLSHYRTAYRRDGMNELAPLSESFPIEAAVLELSPFTVLTKLGAAGEALLQKHGLGHCLHCVCRGAPGAASRPCSLRSAVYMRSNQAFPAIEKGNALADELVKSLAQCQA